MSNSKKIVKNSKK